MSFDPKSIIHEHIASLEAALKAAYDKGVEDGIARIIEAAKASLAKNDGRTDDGSVPGDTTYGSTPKRATIRRAPGGMVPKTVGQMLAYSPGKIIAEYEVLKDDFENGPSISEKSVGNELRRHEGTKYHRDDAGGWWPIVESKEAEDTASNEQSSASYHTNQGGPL